MLLSLIAACMVSVSHCDTTMDASGVTENMVTTNIPTTEEPIREFSLLLLHRESTYSSIDIVWRPRLPEGVTVQKYIVKTTKRDSDSVTISPELPADADEFIVEDLIKDSVFDVCVVASIANSTFSEEREQCLESFTIPYIRDDSMYVLAIVMAVIGSLILFGYLSYRCAVAEVEKRAAEAEAKEEEDDDEGKLLKPVQAKPILLSPVDNSPDRPKSSIEDEDIPFITPPWSEIEREEREKAARNNVA